jgi:hypothetical protein
MKDNKLDEEALLNNDSIKFLTPIRVKLTEFHKKTPDGIRRILNIDFPPGGEAVLQNGVRLLNAIDTNWTNPDFYAFCPRCKNWWDKRTMGRPSRCPKCMERLDKYKLEEINLEEVMKQGKIILVDDYETLKQ